MTSSGKNVRTYPVWVGNLNESVNEAILRESFGIHGTVVSTKVMGDENKRSKGFAYVNFVSLDEAERAAQFMNNRTLYGSTIKAKGPGVLKREGHWNTDPPPASSDFRPVTDCAFFMDGAKCKKGSKCPYRHSELARGSAVVCPGWLDKKCLMVDCPHKHPGGKEKGSKQRAGKDPAVFVATSPSQTFLKCGGKCGDARCSALFLSEEDLSKHVEAAKPPTTAGLPQCVQCRAIFPSHSAYQDHLPTCWARGSVTSTDHSSDSPEVEELSDTDTGEYYDLETFDSQASLKGKGPKTVSPRKKEKVGKKFSNGQARQRTTSGSSSDSRLVLSSNSHGSQSQFMGVKAGGMDSAKYDPSSFDNSTDSYFSLYADGDGDVESDSDSDDEPVEYTMGEMARLLSLNEQDMRDSGDSSDEDAISFQVNSGGARNTGGPVPAGPQGKEDRAASVGGGSSSSGGSKQWTATHKVKLEPVGVFWDIENCPVPVNKSAFGVAAKMRSEFITGKREAEFMCVCDITKERKEVTDELHKAQVTLVHVNAIAKNAADDKLRQSLRRFAHTYPSPATVVLISGDVNFSMELNDLMHLHNLEVVLVHNEQASGALKAFATKLVAYEAFIDDVEPPSRQAPDQHRIVVVSGLPKNMHFSKISSRLDRISDNCGGKVLRVDTNAGTARVLFRTNEWAKKALKRMDGEDVYGYIIRTSLETPPPSSQQQQQQGMGHLMGANLAKTFPPPPQRQPLIGGVRTPPLPHPMYRPPGPPPPPNMAPPFNAMRPPYPMPPQPRGALPPPPLMQGQIRPPGPMGHPRLPPPPATLPPVPPQLPQFSRPPVGNPQNLQNLPRGSLPRPEGRILIFKIPPHEEPALQRNMERLKGNSFISAETMLLWHGYSELQVVLRLDFMQTAIIRKEEIVHTLYERGELGPETASKFVETCTKSVSDVLRRCNLPWEVTTCGWSSEEEENRVIRSNVISLLRRNPTCWTKFSNFKKKYFETYGSAISEMTVHSSCAGAVQILSDYTTTASQIIIFYDFSPLLKIVNDARLHAKLKNDFAKFLSMQPEKKIRLLDFVDSFMRSKIGPLPTSTSGKMLQEIITSVPNVALVGNKPSNIFVTLSAPSNRGTGNGAGGRTEPKAIVPHNLVGISAAFCHLLKESGGPNGIPYKKFQQQYQTFFHRSFRVADYLSGDKGVRDLINVCQGVKIVTLNSGGKREEWVCLDDPSSATPTSLPATSAPSSSNVANTTSPLSAAAAAVSKVSLSSNRSGPTLSPPPSPGPSPTVAPTMPSTSAAPAVRRPSSSASNRSEGSKLRPVETIAVEFRELLRQSPNNQLPLRIFQQSYQTFFHHPFRISTYLSPATAGMKDLLHECQGIQLKSLKLPNGKVEEYVCLDSGTKRASLTEPQPLPKPSSTSSVEGAANYLMPDLVEKFRQDCIEVLTTLEGHSVPLVNFPEHFMKVKKEQFLLANYKAKKMMHLLEAIPEVVQVITSRDIKVIKLCPIDPKKTCEKEVEVLVYEQPNHTITLDRFMVAYQNKYSRRLHFYGHPKLLKLLEEFTNTVEVSGNGPSRPIRLLPFRIFACQMTELLFPQSDPMPISKIVPAFSEKFKKDLNISQYGFPKLIKALEELKDLILIRGVGAARTVKLKSLPHYTSLFASLSPTTNSGVVGGSSTLPPSHLLTDEVTAILMSTHGLKMSLIELTKGYNQAFRGPLAKQKAKVQNLELLQALQNLPNFKITGAGTPTCYVQIAQSSKVTTPPANTKTAKVSGGTSPPAPVKATPIPVQAELGKDPGGSGGILKSAGTEQSAKRKLFDDPSLPGTSASSTSSSPLPEVPQSPRSTGEAGSMQRSPSGAFIEEDENHRLCSETRRMLLTHQEHAMTLTELVESFARGGDPATPTVDSLYAVLKKATGTGADKSPTQKKFEISYFPTDVGASVVQLNRADCLWKLGEDLLNLFVYNPTADMTLAVSDLETLYAECYSRKLVTAVYAAKDISQVLRAKQLKKVIHVSGSKCSPCSPCDSQVLVSLLTELLFCCGKDCVSVGLLPRLYLDHFKVPLPLDRFKVKDPGSLLKLPRVSEYISLDTRSKPVLKPIPLFVEQIRHLLTKFDGRIPKDQLELIFTKEFGTPVSPEVKKYLRKRLPHDAFFVANLANHRWLVWAPTGHPRHQRAQFQNAESVLPFVRNGGGGSSSLQYPDPDDLPQGEVGFTGHTHKEDAEKELGPPVPDSYISTSTLNNAHLLPSEMQSSSADNGKLDPIVTPFTQLDPVSTPSTKPEMDLDENPHSVPLSTSKLEDESSLKPHPILMHEEDKEGPGSSQQIQDESPYDFLKNHPELLEELSKPSHYAGLDCSIPVDDLKIITEVLAVQRLQELGFGASKTSAADSSSSALPPSFSRSSPLLSSATGGDGGPAVPVPTPPKPRGGAKPPLPPNPTADDFLESDLSPDEVLAQLQQLKERCGGVLRPDQMSPFLDYFGELSSRELDRIDALEGKKPKKSGGGGRTKRNMAIRFPSQQPSAATSAASVATDHPELDFSLLDISGKLPVADIGNISDSMSSDEEVMPINRNEYIRRFLEGGDPDNNISNKEDLSVLHSKNDSISEVEGSGRSDDLPRPLLPPSQGGANMSYEDIFNPSKMNF